MFSGKYGVSRPFYFFIQPTYWFGQQASAWFQFRWSNPKAYTLISQQSDEEGLSEVSDSDFSEDTGILLYHTTYMCIFMKFISTSFLKFSSF